MAKERDTSLVRTDPPELLQKIRERTPARLLMGRSGAAYTTETQMQLREAHAAARDAVHTEFNMGKALGKEFVKRWGLVGVSTKARGKPEYLMRPDLGRQFDEPSRATILKCGTQESDLFIAIGDGLSVPAVSSQAPNLLPLLYRGARALGWNVGQIFAIRHCRVGILNELGELLKPKVAVLLIGERPGLATAESLSAYMAFEPRAAQTDADRNLVSNIHRRGLSIGEAAARILRLAQQMVLAKSSGYLLKESAPSLEDR